MRRLTRYVLAELLKVFLVSLGSLTTIIVLFLVGREAVDNGLGVWPIMRMIPYILPEAMRYAVPGTMLLAATNVYGQMAASNEVVAVKAAGISPMVLLWPMIVLAALVSFATVWLNDVAVSWGREGMQRVVIESVEQIAYGMLKTQKSYSTPRMNINVRRVEGRRLIQPTLVLKQTEGRSEITIKADEAQLRSNPAQGTLTIQFLNAEFDFGPGGSGTWPGREQYDVPLSDFSRRAHGALSPSDYRLNKIPEAIVARQETIASVKQEMAASAALQLMTGELMSLTDSAWQARQNVLLANQRKLHRLRTEPHRRWANGFSCLCFVLIGAPMAIRRPQGHFLASFFVCFMPNLLIYYPLLIVGVDQAKSGAWPPQAVWLGNVILVAWGAWLLRRVMRY